MAFGLHLLERKRPPIHTYYKALKIENRILLLQKERLIYNEVVFSNPKRSGPLIMVLYVFTVEQSYLGLSEFSWWALCAWVQFGAGFVIPSCFSKISKNSIPLRPICGSCWTPTDYTESTTCPESIFSPHEYANLSQALKPLPSTETSSHGQQQWPRGLSANLPFIPGTQDIAAAASQFWEWYGFPRHLRT